MRNFTFVDHFHFLVHIRVALSPTCELAVVLLAFVLKSQDSTQYIQKHTAPTVTEYLMQYCIC